MRGALLLVCAMLAGTPLPAVLAGAIGAASTIRDSHTTVYEIPTLNTLLSSHTTEVNPWNHSSFSTKQALQPLANSSALSPNTQGRRSYVADAPIPSRVPSELEFTFTSRAQQQPSSLANDDKDLIKLAKQRMQVEERTNYNRFEAYNVTNHQIESRYEDLVEYDFSPPAKTTVRRGIEPSEWLDEVWPKSYTDTVQSFSVGSREMSHESGSSNETDGSEPAAQASETWTEYSDERAQFAQSIKALMTNQSEQDYRDVDLVLSGERALVQLWPQFGDLLDQLLQLAADACKNIPLVQLISQYQGDDSSKLPMILFTARGSRELRAGERVAAPGGTLLVYVPGWWNTPRDAAARALRAALLPRAGALLVLDTRAAFCRPYLAAAARVQRVAERLAAWLLRCGLPPARLHVVGFSLGAHVAARAALRVRAAAGRRLGRVSALEPAAPCLRGGGGAGGGGGGWRRGARHVQVLHTSRALALRRPLGHADVYARVAGGPASQHAAAWRLYAASARDPAALTAPRCLHPRDLAAGACHGRNATLGFPCDLDARGIYLLNPA